MLAEAATLLGPGRVPGRLYQVKSYPGLVLSDGSDGWVKGEVYRLHDPSALLPVLDDYEGCGSRHAPPFEFDRVLTEATLIDHRRIRCWVYVYCNTTHLSEESRIASGDFIGG
jgi:gamma-glutamylcyclotransferase (GGCT)/AIG2-like uncharacterized protein YtfP